MIKVAYFVCMNCVHHEEMQNDDVGSYLYICDEAGHRSETPRIFELIAEAIPRKAFGPTYQPLTKMEDNSGMEAHLEQYSNCKS